MLASCDVALQNRWNSERALFCYYKSICAAGLTRPVTCRFSSTVQHTETSHFFCWLTFFSILQVYHLMDHHHHHQLLLLLLHHYFLPKMYQDGHQFLGNTYNYFIFKAKYEIDSYTREFNLLHQHPRPKDLPFCGNF